MTLNRAAEFDRLAEKCREEVISEIERLIIAAVLPTANASDRMAADAASAIFKLGLLKAATVPRDSEIASFANKPVLNTREQNRLAILVARQKFAVWSEALTEITLVRRPLCSEASEQSESFH
jgi:hypothetical protein